MGRVRLRVEIEGKGLKWKGRGREGTVKGRTGEGLTSREGIKVVIIINK